MANLQLVYHVNEVRFNDQVLKIENEDWIVGNSVDNFGRESFLIKSPKGDLLPSNFTLVNNGTHVGIQFEVDNYFPLGRYGYPKERVKVDIVALVRQPHNAWLWAYLMDEYGNNIATFCGYDDLDGLARFVLDLKKEYDV